MALKLKRALFLLLPLFLQACAMQQGKVNFLAEGLEQSGSKATLLALQESDISDRDRGQFLLNTGLLKSISGDVSGGTQDLEAAKAILNALQATSVSETLGAATINETLRSYDSSPSERVLLHELLSINYLMQNDLDSARVEVLQAAVVMDEVARADELIGQLASSHYIAGLVYELGGELDNAMISYRKAERIMTARTMPTPPALQHTLLNLSQHLGLDDEYEKYSERFNLTAEPISPDSAEVVVLYWDGVVTSKEEKSLNVWVPSLEQVVSLAVPSYPESNYIERPLTLNFGGQRHITATLEDVEALAREDLDDDFALTYSITLARVIAKVEMVKSASKQNGSLGMLMNIATLLTESADIRSWNMLPSSIQVARFSVPPGQYPLPLTHFSTSNIAKIKGNTEINYDTELENSTELKDTTRIGNSIPTETNKISVKAGDKVVLFIPSVSHKTFYYTLSAGHNQKI